MKHLAFFGIVEEVYVKQAYAYLRLIFTSDMLMSYICL